MADRYDESSEQALQRIDPHIWDNVGLNLASFSRIRETVEMNLSSCIAMFFPKAA
jgi:hypothetical protein